MLLQDSYTLITTNHFEASIRFYTRFLNFTPEFGCSWFTLLKNGPHSLAFMQSGHPSQPPEDRIACDPKGIFLTFQVTNAAAEYHRLSGAGASIHRPLHDEPWGQRHFMLLDPNGIKIDVVEQIAPAPGFWEQYP